MPYPVGYRLTDLKFFDQKRDRCQTLLCLACSVRRADPLTRRSKPGKCQQTRALSQLRRLAPKNTIKNLKLASMFSASKAHWSQSTYT
jgi:hypothetical protein